MLRAIATLVLVPGALLGLVALSTPAAPAVKLVAGGGNGGGGPVPIGPGGGAGAGGGKVGAGGGKKGGKPTLGKKASTLGQILAELTTARLQVEAAPGNLDGHKAKAIADITAAIKALQPAKTPSVSKKHTTKKKGVGGGKTGTGKSMPVLAGGGKLPVPPIGKVGTTKKGGGKVGIVKAGPANPAAPLQQALAELEAALQQLGQLPGNHAAAVEATNAAIQEVKAALKVG
jgi:hypothetical protein